MVKYKLIRESDDIMEYECYPEGKEKCGEVAISKKTGDAKILHLAENDEIKMYARKMLWKIRTFYHAGEYRNEGMVAWY